MSKQPENKFCSENYISLAFQKRMAQLIEENYCNNNEAFSKLVGVSTPVITKSVNLGIIPTVKPLLKIANALQLPFDYITGKSDDKAFYPATIPSSFHERLISLKKENQNNWSSILLKLPFPRTYIYEWIKEGTYPCVDYLYALAKILKVNVDYLLGRTDYRD